MPGEINRFTTEKMCISHLPINSARDAMKAFCIRKVQLSVWNL